MKTLVLRDPNNPENIIHPKTKQSRKLTTKLWTELTGGYSGDGPYEIESKRELRKKRTAQPQMSQPRMSQPRMSQPRMSQPLMSQPRMSQPLMSNMKIPVLRDPNNPNNIIHPITQKSVKLTPKLWTELTGGYSEDGAYRIQKKREMSQPQMSQPRMSQPRMTQPQMSQLQMPQPQMSQLQMTQPQMSQPQMPMFKKEKIDWNSVLPFYKKCGTNKYINPVTNNCVTKERIKQIFQKSGPTIVGQMSEQQMLQQQMPQPQMPQQQMPQSYTALSNPSLVRKFNFQFKIYSKDEKLLTNSDFYKWFKIHLLERMFRLNLLHLNILDNHNYVNIISINEVNSTNIYAITIHLSLYLKENALKYLNEIKILKYIFNAKGIGNYNIKIANCLNKENLTNFIKNPKADKNLIIVTIPKLINITN